nr:SRPBCC family protein [Marinicella sp. W31]MDC2877116.1 SRPBCC family protein [Marinicella sp. W31]
MLLNREERRIDVSYVDGPFRFLDNRWHFEPEGETTCAVNFYINYEFKNRILGAMMGSMFDRAFRKFSEAFEGRADAIYD